MANVPDNPSTPPTGAVASLEHIQGLDALIREAREAVEAVTDPWVREIDEGIEQCGQTIRTFHDTMIQELNTLGTEVWTEAQYFQVARLQELDRLILGSIEALWSMGVEIPGMPRETPGGIVPPVTPDNIPIPPIQMGGPVRIPESASVPQGRGRGRRRSRATAGDSGGSSPESAPSPAPGIPSPPVPQGPFSLVRPLSPERPPTLPAGAGGEGDTPDAPQSRQDAPSVRRDGEAGRQSPDDPIRDGRPTPASCVPCPAPIVNVTVTPHVVLGATVAAGEAALTPEPDDTLIGGPGVESIGEIGRGLLGGDEREADKRRERQRRERAERDERQAVEQARQASIDADIPTGEWVPESWCERLARIRPFAIALGKAVSVNESHSADKYTLNKAEVRNLLVAWYRDEDSPAFGRALDQFESARRAFNTGKALQVWIVAATQNCPAKSGDYVWIARARAVVEYIGTLNTNANIAHTSNVGLSLSHTGSAEFGGTFKLLLGGSSGVGTSRASTWSWTRTEGGAFGGEMQLAFLPLLTALRYLENLETLEGTLSIEQAASLAARGHLSNSEYRCYAGMLGIAPTEADKLRTGAAQVLSPDQTIQAWRRGLLTREQRDGKLRQDGWLWDDDKALLVALSDYVPGPSDIIRFMVRDVEDRGIIDRFGLDDEFTDKFLDKVVEYARANGISTELMIRYWRAHWDNPSLTQALEMFHRLRPGKESPEGKDISVTEADLKALMAQVDIVPFWRDRLIAISYHPLTRVDAQRMFMLGVIDVTALHEAFLNIGYDDENATGLVKFTETRREAFLERSPEARAYREGAISAADLATELQRYHASPEEVAATVKRIDLAVKSRLNRRCIDALRKRYLNGETDRDETLVALQRRNVSATLAVRYVESWSCEMDARGKVVPAQALSRMFREGTIGEPDLLAGLIRVGHSDDDARRLARTIRAETARWKRGETQRAENLSRNAVKRERQKRLENARRQSRRRAVFTLLDSKLGIPPDVAAVMLDQARDIAAGEYGWGEAEAETLALDAAKGFVKVEAESWEKYVVSLIEADNILPPDDLE